MSDETRQAVAKLLAARKAGGPEQVAPALTPEVSYWDPDHGEVFGREAVAELLTTSVAAVEVETVAAAGEDAVAELRLHGADRVFRSTEVYRVTAGRVRSIRAYFEPAAD